MNARISPHRIKHAAQLIDPVFKCSPQFWSEQAYLRFGSRILFKVETINPIRSFKGRGCDFLLHTLCGANKPSHIVCASAGNFGQGVAYASGKHGIPTTVFAASNANPLKITRMLELGAQVKTFGRDFDEAKIEAENYAADHGFTFVEDGREPSIAEGAGTIASELTQSHEMFDGVVVPMGNGSLISGIGCWLKATNPRVKIVGVCATGAPAMARSWKSKNPENTPDVNTICDGIAVRNIVSEALNDIVEFVDDVLLVEDDACLEAMRFMYSAHGIVTEPAGAAGLAAVISHPNYFHNLSWAVPICGGNITDDQFKQWKIGGELYGYSQDPAVG